MKNNMMSISLFGAMFGSESNRPSSIVSSKKLSYSDLINTLRINYDQNLRRIRETIKVEQKKRQRLQENIVQKYPVYKPKDLVKYKNNTKLYRVRHIKCYRAIALKLFIISKNVSDKSFSVLEGRHTGPPSFFIGGGAKVASRSTPLFKMEPCIFFDEIIADFKTNSVTYNTRSF